jgi:phthalate 4,5-cis-dihydrodiol dehydrogenase
MLVGLSVRAPDAPLAVALVGAGNHGAGVLLPTLLELNGVELAAVCDPTPGRARSAVRTSNGASKALATLEQALATLPLDALVVACPPAAHVSALELALDAGVPIFVEKPPAATTDDLARLAALAGRRNALVGVGMNLRYSTAISHVQRVLADPSMGDVVSLTIRHMANKPRSSLWGTSVVRSVLLAQLVHPVDLARWLAGPVAEVETRGWFHDTELTVVCALTHESGAMTSIVATTSAPRFRFTLSAATDRGAMVECRDLWEVLTEGPSSVDGLPSEQRWAPGPLDRGYRRAGYAPELAAFFDAVRNGTSFEPGLDDLLATFRVLDDVSEALDDR